MKKILFTTLVIVLFAFPAAANWSITLQWQWDETPQAGDVFEIFQRTEGDTYDLSTPFVTIPVDVASTGTYQTSEIIDLSEYAGSTVTKYFAVRAKRGSFVSDLSNQVSYDFEIGLKGPYNLTINVSVAE